VIREYRWDQQDRLVRFLEGTHESVYEYDGASRRVRIKELTSSVETKNETFVWCGSRICQKRASNGSTVLRNYFKQGFEEGSTDYFYTRDHLGSVREVVESSGTTIASRVSYDPWGKPTETGSGALTDFAFTGHHYDRRSELSLTRYRGYDPTLGRWLSRDPIGLAGGVNLYGYVDNDPLSLFDPTGLAPNTPGQCHVDDPRKHDELRDHCIVYAVTIYISCRAAGYGHWTCVGLGISEYYNCMTEKDPEPPMPKP
jgi:RHS repeat-associated protein